MILDAIVAVILLISISIALLRGFIREVLTIFGIGGGVVAAYICGPLLLPYMNGWLGVTGGDNADMMFDIIPYEYVSYALSYGIMFVVFVIVLSILSHFLAELAKNLGLGALDRTLGAVFGIARGVLVLGLLYWPFLNFASDEQKELWFGGSKSQIYLKMTSAWIDGSIPKSVEENMDIGIEKAKSVSDMGKKLQEMNVLKSQSDESSESKSDGYTPEFRDKMDEMFEESNDTSPEYND